MCHISVSGSFLAKSEVNAHSSTSSQIQSAETAKREADILLALEKCFVSSRTEVVLKLISQLEIIPCTAETLMYLKILRFQENVDKCCGTHAGPTDSDNMSSSVPVTIKRKNHVPTTGLKRLLHQDIFAGV